MRWQTKAAAQRFLARMPGGNTLYGIGQRYLGGLRHFTIDGKVRQGERMLRALAAAGHTLDGRRGIEAGTGWAPVVPMVFWLHGLNACDTYDVTALMDESLVVASAQQLVEHYERRGPQDGPIVIRLDRLDHLRRVTATGRPAAVILETCGIRYHAPADVSISGRSDASVDLFFSNTVLEHVPVDAIRRMFREANRVVRPGGLMLHLIDPSDHFSHGDRTISAVNFLQFSEQEFAKYNTPFCYQNRLRALAYGQLAEEARFEVLHTERRLDEKALAALSGLTLHREFAAEPPEELCVTSIALVCARRPETTCD